MNIKKILKQYIKDNLNEHIEVGRKSKMSSHIFYGECCKASEESIDNYIENEKVENTFQTKLFNYIDSKGLKDSDVYNKVNVDRRLFSKIRSDINYHPSKETVILLGIALKLSEEEIEDLLHKASYSLPKNNVYDLIIRFCFKEKIYDLDKVNEFLFDYNLKTLNN